jgi:DNA sulfur modification protein DndD
LNLNVGELERTKSNAEQAKAKLAERLHEISEFLPFAIAAGKFTELVEHIQSEETLQRKSAAKKEVQEQAEEFLESLFNRPPYPQEDMTMKQESFYYTKAEELFGNLYLGESDGESLLSFTHDLGKGATDYIFDTYANLQRQSDQLFQGVFNDYIRIKNDLNDVQRDLNRARAHAEDDNILDWKENLRTAQQNRDQAIQEKGSLSNDLIRLQEETKTTENRKSNLLNQVEVSKQDQGKIDEVNRYITSLKEFVQAQKIAKCHSLEKNILHEMHRIMHKKDFLDEVRVKILPDGDGLEVVILKNEEDVPLPSSGEKQIFISCLLKAILTEAIVDLPVFIDTPLGRLDRQHKDNFVKDYYPYLANQVVILSTDEEITQRRKHEIEQFVSHAYLLVNRDNQTTILNEYF